MVDHVGQQIGHYRLIRLLGAGGFAKVYLGEHIHLNTLAAIKVQHALLSGNSVEKFRSEASTIANLKHKHIVRVLDFGVEDQIPFLVMDYAPHGTLRQQHPSGMPVPLTTILLYIKQIADALQYVHNQKLIHRDIKPHNMLLSSNDEVLLSDFGIVTLAQSTHSQSIQDVAGTVTYMAPEQLQGKPRPASDQYALGIVVYEWLCGRCPFSGSYAEIASQHLLVPPPSLHMKLPKISADVEEVVFKALAKEPRQRFTNIQAFVIALEEASQPKPIILSKSQATLLTSLPSSLPSSAIIEDHENRGNIVEHAEASLHADIRPELDEEQNITESSRIQGVPSPINDSSNIYLPPSLSGVENDDIPPAFDQRQQSLLADQLEIRSSKEDAGNRPLQAISLTQPRSNSLRSTQIQKKKLPSKPNAPRKGSRGAILVRSTQPTRPLAQQKAKKLRVGNIGISVLVGMLVLVLLGLLAYLGPSADVTVTLPSHGYKLQLSLTASATSRQDVKLHTLPAHVLTFESSATGTGHATGSTVQARGTVFFNNTGSGNIVVPTGTIVATKNNVQFLTQAEELALPGNNNPPTFVQAVIAGVSGNVAANSISVIPPDSQAKILQANSGLTAPLALSVTNTDPITGGAGSATSVSNDDANREKAALDPQLQAQVQHFMTKNVGPNDQLGKMMQTETPVSTPAAGNVVVNGNFTETVTLHLTVLVVRAADLQAAAKAQLNTVLDKQKTGLALVPQQVVQLTQIKNTPSKDGTSLALNLLATGQVAPQVSENTVRSLVTGKSIDDATHAIMGSGGIPHALNTQITISPSFFGWVPFYSPRITIHFLFVLVK